MLFSVLTRKGRSLGTTFPLTEVQVLAEEADLRRRLPQGQAPRPVPMPWLREAGTQGPAVLGLFRTPKWQGPGPPDWILCRRLLLGHRAGVGEVICRNSTVISNRQLLVGHQWSDWHHLGCFQFSSVAQSSPTLCDPMGCSTPGFPVHHQLPELAHTHVHQASNAIQNIHWLF